VRACAAAAERAERSPAPLGRLASEEDGHRLRRAVSELPESQRLVVVLTAWEGLDLRETARLLAMRYSTAKSNLHHAREALRRRLGGREGR
jgi:RNA polymerase sigma-70 factor (ECF subfamily)